MRELIKFNIWKYPVTGKRITASLWFSPHLLGVYINADRAADYHQPTRFFIPQASGFCTYLCYAALLLRLLVLHFPFYWCCCLLYVYVHIPIVIFKKFAHHQAGVGFAQHEGSAANKSKPKCELNLFWIRNARAVHNMRWWSWGVSDGILHGWFRGVCSAAQWKFIINKRETWSGFLSDSGVFLKAVESKN